MSPIQIIIFIFLLLIIFWLLIKQYSLNKQLKEMRTVIQDIIHGNSKRRIFSNQNNNLGQLGYQINELASLYDTSKMKYENEQQVKKQLISNLSHDVRTPLVSVIGYLEAIVENRIATDQKEEYINTAYQKALQLKEQVNQLFEFVQNDENEIQLILGKIDLCETTRQLLIDFLPIIENEQITLDIDIPDKEIFALVDKESYIRVVQNIIKNTLTHAAEGKYIGIFLKCDEKNVFVDIADKGQGIGEEHLPYVFERLYKVDQVRSRSGGLGLAIAKELANKMNGDVVILRSIPGDTVFRIMFPQAF